MANKTNSTKATKATKTTEKPLSMTPEAIRARARRAAKKADHAATNDAIAERVKKLQQPPVTEARPLGTKAAKINPLNPLGARTKGQAERDRQAMGESHASIAASRHAVGTRTRQGKGKGQPPAPTTLETAAGASVTPVAAPPVSAAVAQATLAAQALQAANPETLRQRTVVLRVSASAWNPVRRVEGRDIDVHKGNGEEAEVGDKRLLSLRKRLLQSDELRTVIRLQDSAFGQMRGRFGHQIPGLPGTFIVALSNVERAYEFLAEQQTKVEEALEAFLVVYEGQKAEMRLKLGDLYDEHDYPSPNVMRTRFGLRWRCLDLGTPTDKLSAINPLLAAQDAQRAEEFWREAAESIRVAMSTTLMELIDHLHNALVPDEEGKPKVLRRSAIENLTAFLDAFATRNVTDDRALADLVRQATAVLAGAEVKDLRDDEAMRQALAQRMQGVRQAVSSLTQLRGSREIVLPAA